jgi:hypothetical protein
VVNEPSHVWSHSVSFQHKQAPLAIHHAKSLLQIEEDTVEWALLEVGQLLSQFCLNNSHPGAPVVLASVQALMECDGVKPLVHYVLNDLPNWLQQSDSAVVANALGYQDDNDPAQLLGDRACLPHSSDQPHQQAP